MTPVRTICTWVGCDQTFSLQQWHTHTHISWINLFETYWNCFFDLCAELKITSFVFSSQCLSWLRKGKLSLFYLNDIRTVLSSIVLVVIANSEHVYWLVCSGQWWKCRLINLSVKTRRAFTSKICSGESSIVSLLNFMLFFHLASICVE